MTPLIIRFAPASPFAHAVTERVRNEFAGARESRFADAAVWLRAAGYLAASILAYMVMLHGGHSAHATLTLATLASFCAFMIIIAAGHDAAHGSLSSKRSINNLVVFASYAVLGVSGALYRKRHVRLHHQFPNVPGTGIDADGSGVLRLSPHKRRRAIHTLQPVYGPMLYFLGALYLVWVEDFFYLIVARRSQPAEFRTWRALAAFAGTKALHVLLFLIIPAISLRPSLPALLGTYLVAMGASSITFIVLLVGTHISELAAFPMPDANGRLSHDWATHQVVTSVDWFPTNKFVVLLVGGANAEAAHHLFPHYSHRHSALLSRILGEEAAAHGIEYHSVSFTHMLRAHWHQITLLSRPVDFQHAARHAVGVRRAFPPGRRSGQ